MSTSYKNAFGKLLYQTDASTKNFFGTVASETLIGTSGNDTLLSNGGPDKMIGGAGDDIYVVYTAKDQVIELKDGGNDTVQSFDKYVLPENVENLIIQGNSAWYGAGNALDNIITSKSVGQQIDGGAGNDVLIGSTNTTFIITAGNGSDTLVNWNSTDHIRLNGYGLTSFAQVQSIARQVGSDTQLNFANGEKLVLNNVAAKDLTAAAFDLSFDTSKLKLTFADEFNSLSLWTKGGTWRTELGYGGAGTISSRTLDNSSQIYMDADWAGTGKKALGVNPFSIDNGVLTITATPTAADVKPLVGNYAYTSGVISSKFSFAQEYGYIEARVQMPAGQGFWPQLWMIPTDNTWPPEIDIFEVLGKDPNTVYMTDHYVENGKHLYTQDRAYIDTTQFHTYGVDWTAETLTYYIDGVKVAQQKTPAGMDREMFIIADLAVGGSWSGSPDATTGTGQMKIDYIRAYQTASTVSTTVNGVHTVYDPTATVTPTITTPAVTTPVVTTPVVTTPVVATPVVTTPVVTTPVVVKPVNVAPVGVADSYAATEDSKLTVDKAHGVLANDTDANGDVLTATLVSGPAHGTLTLAADGSFVYNPAGNYNGPDSFIYAAKDPSGATSPTVTVSLNVAAVNDGPVAVNDSGFTTAYGTALKIVGGSLLANDSDVDGDALTIVSVQGASNGTVSLVSGDVVFTPTAGYSGAAAFAYTISDGHGGTATASASLTVGAKPVVAPIVIEPVPASTYIYGSAGNDIYDKSGSNYAWMINGASGNDILIGSKGNDSLNGGEGNDSLDGGAGNDTITGGKGIDKLVGGAGNDTFIFKPGDLVLNSSAGTDRIMDFEGAGVAGGDTINFMGFSAAAKLSVLGGANADGAFLYHIQDGANSGDILIYTGGKLLGAGDYAFY